MHPLAKLMSYRLVQITFVAVVVGASFVMPFYFPGYGAVMFGGGYLMRKLTHGQPVSVG